MLIQETWLDKSREEIKILGYRTISRRDRLSNEKGGGVLTLARDDFNAIVHVSNSKIDERSWHYVNLGPENILLGNWYRPPGTAHDGFTELQSELNNFASEITGVALSGDLNIHHIKWLRYSNANTNIGADMEDLCDRYGFRQLVREPTRNAYLLDLFITDLPGCESEVLPAIADHRAVLTKLPLPKIVTK